MEKSQLTEPILLVDDEADSLKLLAMQTEKLGLKTLTAANGVAALEILSKETPFLIISDYRMEKMNGLDLCCEAKKLHPRTPFVLLTGFADKEIAIAGLQKGLDRILEKPIALNEFSAIVAEYAKSRAETVAREAAEFREILFGFVEECNELISDIDQQILKLESLPVDEVVIDLLFRKIHSIKGGVGNFPNGALLHKLAHQFESALSQIKKSELIPDQSWIDLFLACVDLIRTLLQTLKTLEQPANDHEKLAHTLIDLLKNKKSGTPNATAPKLITPQANREENKEEDGIPVSSEKLDALMKISGELVFLKNKFQMIATDSDTLNDSNKLRKKISDLSISLNRSTDLLQEQMMQIRKISLNRAFSKIPRLTRQTAQDLGKKVNYKTDGTDLLVDKNVARALSVSMTHLTRNAVDHGIETSEDRQRAGKPPVGTVQIKAKENAGIIFIEIEDDGRGSNIEKVKNKALQQKLITTEQAKLMADNEARELIFLPGFSTAEKISAVSGRGVGMDVVKTAIEEIHGKVKILPGTPSGSKILMEIPVPKTVMVEQSIIALSSEILVAIPLPAIARIVPREKVEITRLKERAVMQHEGKSIFLIRHTDLSNNSRQKIDFNNTNGVIVILRGKDRKIALWLDTILDQTEAVIRAFDQVMGEIPGFKGTTVLDDDRIAWVISPVEFVAQALNADGDNNQ